MKANLVSHARDWPYSNYKEWIGLKAGDLKDDEFLRSYFPTPKEYEQFVANGRDGKRDPGPIANYILE